MSVLGPKAYIFGGELLPRQPVDNQSDVVDVTVESRDGPQTLAVVDAPSPRVGAPSVSANGYIWLFSGRGGPAMDPIDEQGGVWRCDAAIPSWDLIETASYKYPAARSYHAMASDGAKTIYLHAGCPSQGRLSDLWAFDTASLEWTELPSAPGPARGGTSITFCQGKLYRVGGFDGTSEQGGVVDVYDPAASTWQSISFSPDDIHGPGARSVAALLAVRSEGEPVLVSMFGEGDPSSLGHAGAGKMLHDVWLFHIRDAAWKKMEFEGDVPSARAWFAADVLQGRDGDAVIVHGGLAADNSRLGDVWRLELA
ncbi:Kelch-type beta propeller [Metarhizium album ARSEF 1941]|uniref:Kelch-type beta propeller n=1 Tax=Metarhizium album (strain ARSEF 1941) TaxID=1081103 RepID=A0A0B2WVI8_METAS|nr:Kelch-type beta propeller [Metarhizium album ARSEF 1941]KHN97467.1 Kelch-type beta propeller [Metarhizium album ARSEF 1941]